MLFKGKRGLLYNSQARAALRSVQPFVNLEAAQNVGVAQDQTFEESFLWSELHRLDTLWNIDKHRRLTLMAWWPDLIHWSSNGPSNRKAFPGDGTLADGSVLLYIEGADEDQGDEIRHRFNLVLTDDPAFPRNQGITDDVVDVLEQWRQHIVDLVSQTASAPIWAPIGCTHLPRSVDIVIAAALRGGRVAGGTLARGGQKRAGRSTGLIRKFRRARRSGRASWRWTGLGRR
jgi:hypothetical protein